MNAAQFFDHWQIVFRDLMRAVAMLKDADLAFRPAETYPRTVGDILRHMISLEQGWIHFVIRRQLKAWPDTADGELNTVAEIKQALDATHRDTFNYLSTIPVEDFQPHRAGPQRRHPQVGLDSLARLRAADSPPR